MSQFVIDLTFVQVFLMVLLRVSGLFVFSPIFGSVNVPQQVRIFMSVLFAYVMYAFVANVQPEVPIDSLSYVLILVKEFLVGLAIGYTGMVIINALQFAGEMIDTSMGLHMASAIDPLNRTQASVVGQVIYIYAIFILLMTNSHHFLISVLAKSFEVIPLSGAVIDGRMADVLVMLFMRIFSLGFQIAIPIAGILFVLTFTLGLVAKAVPQINVFFVGIPAKILVGLFLLTTSMHFFYPILADIVMSMGRDLMLIVEAMS